MVDLGLTDARFWVLTLREFDMLVERRMEVRRIEVDAPQAHLASILANIHRDTKERRDPFLLEEFLLWPAERRLVLTQDEVLAAKLKAMVIALHGKVNL